MSRLEMHLLARACRLLGVGLLAFTSLMLSASVVERLRWLRLSLLPLPEYGLYLLCQLPAATLVALPLFSSLAAAWTLISLSRHGELLALESLGFSPTRAVRPVLWMGLLAGLLSLGLREHLVPPARACSARLEALVKTGRPPRPPAWLFDGRLLLPREGLPASSAPPATPTATPSHSKRPLLADVTRSQADPGPPPSDAPLTAFAVARDGHPEHLIQATRSPVHPNSQATSRLTITPLLPRPAGGSAPPLEPLLPWPDQASSLELPDDPLSLSTPQLHQLAQRRTQRGLPSGPLLPYLQLPWLLLAGCLLIPLAVVPTLLASRSRLEPSRGTAWSLLICLGWAGMTCLGSYLASRFDQRDTGFFSTILPWLLQVGWGLAWSRGWIYPLARPHASRRTAPPTDRPSRPGSRHVPL